MRQTQAVVQRWKPAQGRTIALAMALSVAVAAAPGDALAGGSNNGKGAGAGSSTGSSSGNNGNDKGVGNAAGPKGGSNGNGDSGSGNGSGNSNAGGNGGGSPGGSGSSGSNGSNGNAASASLPVCALSDISGGAALCSGYYQGNLLNNSAPDLAAQLEGLQLVGLADWDGSLVESQLDLAGATVDFTSLLNGFTFIGVHYGAGANSPSPQTPGGVTAFYRFDAGVNLDTFLLTPGSVSAARLYSTGPAFIEPLLPDDTGSAGGIVDQVRTAVPEPTTWAMMIMGFGLAGAVLRRRRAQVVAA